MTWIKENKFLAGLLGITVLLAALLIFFGMKSSKGLEEVQAEIAAKQSSLVRMKKLDPYPTDESAKAKETNLKTVLAKANEVREKLLAFRPGSLDNVPGKTFSENLSVTVEKVKQLFPGEDALPNTFHLGFESYTGSLPKEDATGVLTYELGAMEYLFEELAAAGVTEIRNLHRAKLPPENGDSWPNEAKPTRSRGGNRPTPKKNVGGPRRAPVTFETHPYIAHRLPFEVVFKGPELAVRQVLTNLGNSDKYFFDVRAGRVLNPSPIPSGGKSASAAAKAKESDFGTGIVIEGVDPPPATDSGSAPSVKVLEKVSGGDELIVYLRADLLLFLEEQKFPELK
jgi:hypothetical protein